MKGIFGYNRMIRFEEFAFEEKKKKRKLFIDFTKKKSK